MLLCRNNATELHPVEAMQKVIKAMDLRLCQGLARAHPRMIALLYALFHLLGEPIDWWYGMERVVHFLPIDGEIAFLAEETIAEHFY